jgi:hypothetical protein
LIVGSDGEKLTFEVNKSEAENEQPSQKVPEA